MYGDLPYSRGFLPSSRDLLPKFLQAMQTCAMSGDVAWQGMLQGMCHVGVLPDPCHQLYKSLEHQYQLGLETLNESLTELKVELIFKQGMIQYRPSLEYLREKYYQKMKEFITIPLRFKGFGGADFFAGMPERSWAGLCQAGLAQRSLNAGRGSGDHQISSLNPAATPTGKCPVTVSEPGPGSTRAGS